MTKDVSIKITKKANALKTQNVKPKRKYIKLRRVSDNKRQKQLVSLYYKAVNNNMINTSFLNSALQHHKNIKKKLDNIQSYKIGMTINRDSRILKLNNQKNLTSEKLQARKEKIQNETLKDMKKLDEIKKKFDSKCVITFNELMFLKKLFLPKPMSGYMLYAKEIRSNIKASEPEMSFGEVGKKIGSMWQQMDDNAKNEWKAKAMKMFKEMIDNQN
jgi:lipopolysaccharide export LptBFGC system permease protein LptF